MTAGPKAQEEFIPCIIQEVLDYSRCVWPSLGDSITSTNTAILSSGPGFVVGMCGSMTQEGWQSLAAAQQYDC